MDDIDHQARKAIRGLQAQVKVLQNAVDEANRKLGIDAVKWPEPPREF